MVNPSAVWQLTSYRVSATWNRQDRALDRNHFFGIYGSLLHSLN